MAARLSPSRPESVPATVAVLRPVESPVPLPESRHRVVSVSPHLADIAAVHGMATIHAPPPESAAAGIDQLGGLAERLEKLVKEGRAQDVQSTKSSLQLQERLRLGARMLRAFQTQIDRVESTLKSQQEHERKLRQLDAEIELKVAAAQVRLETTLRQFVATLDESSQAAMRIHGQRLEERGGETQARVADDTHSRVTNDMTWLTSTMRDVALRVEQLAALAPAAAPFAKAMSNDGVTPTVETTVDAPLKFQRYTKQAQG